MATRFWASNLKTALHDAIEIQTEREKKQGYTSDSAYLAGIKTMYESLKESEEIYIEYDKQ